MLRILNKDKQTICGLDRYQQLRVTKRLQFDDKTLEFTALIGDIADLENEGYIETETDRFVIKEIKPSSNGTADVLAQLDVETLEGKTFIRFETVEKTLSEAMAIVFAGTGWTVGTCEITKRRTLRKENCTAFDMLKQALSVYRCECKIDTKEMTVSFYEEIGSDRGVYFMSDLNLRSLSVSRTSYDFYTEIEPYGAEGMTIEEVNDGSKVLTNYTYSSKRKRIIWKDERYTVPESLMEDAQAKLNDYSKPYVSYMADVVDLASMTEDYSILEYDIGDTITLADDATGTMEKQRIVEMVVYPEQPEMNSCIFANTTLTFEELASKFNETADTVDNITIDNGTIDGDKVNKLDAARLYNFDTVLSASGVFGTLVANHAAFEEATVSRFTADEASIAELRTNYADVAIARIGVLETDYGSIRSLLAGTAAATEAEMIHLNVQNAMIDEAFLKSLMAQYITVNDLLAGTIYTNKHAVMSEDGAMVMDGSLLTFKDANGTVRIQIGKDGQGNYNYYLTNADGDIIWDAAGITADGISDGLIVDDMVADSTDTYHGISASKLNIHSMIGAINEEGGLKSSSIVMDEDGQSLTVAFANMRDGIDSLAKGGNNLIVGTLNPDMSEVTKYPKIIGQTVPTVINGTAAVAEHGIKSIGSTGTTPGFEFGSDSTASASMNGLKAGETYTLSFDASWKLFSEYTGTDKQELDMVFGYMPTQNSSFIYKTIPISEVTSGTDESCSFSGTFTVPTQCVAVYIGIAGDNNYMQINDHTLLYPPFSPGDTIEINGTQIQVDSFSDTDCIEINGNPIPKQGGLCADGDYIELKNLKLERGSIATAWSPASEDYLEFTQNKYSELSVTIDGITGRVGTLETTTTNQGKTIASHTSTLEQTATKLSAIITDSQIAELESGTNMYDKLTVVKATADGASSSVTSLNTWKDTASGQIANLQSKQNTFEQTLTGTTSRVSNIEKDYLTTSAAQTLINQSAESVTIAVNKTIAGIKVGGRNLIINTLDPDVSKAANYPRLVGQESSTAVPGGTKTAVEHGIKIEVSSATRPYVRFGSNSASSGKMNGLEAGQTYTLSFDANWKVLSGTVSGSTNNFMRAYLYTDAAKEGTFASTEYFSFGTITPDDRGDEMSGRCEFTFTVPETAKMLYLLVQPNLSTSSAYTAGDYLELKNIKLEKGNKATDWTAAPEDYAGKGDALNNVVIEYATGDSPSTAPSTGWGPGSPTWTQGKYIWQRTAITKNGSTTYSNVSCIQGARGETGASGENGEKGDTGVGIREVIPRYCLWTSDTNPPADSYSDPTYGWFENKKPDWAEGRYIWMQTKIVYDDDTVTNPHVEYTTAICDTTLNSLESRVSKAELKITDDAIISTVSASYGIADANLIYNSTGFGGSTDGWELSTSSTSYKVVADYEATRPGKTDYALGIVINSTLSNTVYMRQTSEHLIDVTAHKTYTLSGYYYRGANVKTACYVGIEYTLNGSTWARDNANRVQLTESAVWTAFEITFTPSNTAQARVYLRTAGANATTSDNTVYLEDLVFVRGESAMSWTESPTSLIEQSADMIRLQAEKLVWVANNSSLTEAGYLTVTGGQIGGFAIDSTSIRNLASTSTASGSVLLSTADVSRTIAGTARTDVRFAIGSNMGVTNDGTLYASKGHFSGEITSTTGTIGGIKIYSNGIASDNTYTEDGALFHDYLKITKTGEIKIYSTTESLEEENPVNADVKFHLNRKGKLWVSEFGNDYWNVSGKKITGRYASGYAYTVALTASDSDLDNGSGWAMAVSTSAGESTYILRHNGSVQCTALTISALTSGTGSAVVANSSGRLYVTSSSNRYKDYIADMTESEAEKLYDLPVVQFKYKDGYLDREDEAYDKPLHGFFAEDVADLFSDGGIHNTAGDVENYSERAIIARLVKLVQMQHREIESLKASMQS